MTKKCYFNMSTRIFIFKRNMLTVEEFLNYLAVVSHELILFGQVMNAL